MYTISKEFHFAASHCLEGLAIDHPCSRTHGHNYIVIVEFQSDKLDETGFVIDYRALEPIKKWIDEHVDHRHLNDLLSFNPTAENIAQFFFKKFVDIMLSQLLEKGVKLSAITVKETDKTAARYEHTID